MHRRTDEMQTRSTNTHCVGSPSDISTGTHTTSPLRISVHYANPFSSKSTTGSTELARALLGGSISSLKSLKPPFNFPEAGGFLGTLTPLPGSSQRESDGQSKGEGNGRKQRSAHANPGTQRIVAGPRTDF